MKRRDFLWAMSAAALTSKAASGGQNSKAAAVSSTVLYDGHAVTLDRTSADPDLWVLKTDLPRINGFQLKPQGACRADVCIPVPKTMMRGTDFNLSAFAKKVGQHVVADTESRVWSFGEIPVVRGAYLESRQAPPLTVSNRKGQPVSLAQFRGKKVLLVTWASW